MNQTTTDRRARWAALRNKAAAATTGNGAPLTSAEWSEYDAFVTEDDPTLFAPARDLAQEMGAEVARREAGPWFPACAGTEVPFTARDGRRLQYLWQPSTNRHAYIDLDRDVFLTDDEATRVLA